jgi:hypothetical protein
LYEVELKKLCKFTQEYIILELMQLTYQFASADDINAELLEAIKGAFKSNAITLMVQTTVPSEELPEALKTILDDRLEEDVATYLTSEESISLLREKYGI